MVGRVVRRYRSGHGSCCHGYLTAYLPVGPRYLLYSGTRACRLNEVFIGSSLERRLECLSCDAVLVVEGAGRRCW